MLRIYRKPALLLTGLIIVYHSTATACGIAGYGTIGTYAFGWVLSPYTVYNNVTATVRLVKQYGQPDKAVPSITNTSCSVINGNNLTLITNNSFIQSFYAWGAASAGRFYDLTILSSWTVAYNAKLKGSFSGAGNWQNPETKSPANGGGGSFDVSMAYEYSSSNSGSVSYYCGVTAQ